MCSTLLETSLILAKRQPIYQDFASKFFEDYVSMIDSMNSVDNIGRCSWGRVKMQIKSRN